jgi:methylated-DNA-[protein]-cysteine S-methyltransferase
MKHDEKIGLTFQLERVPTPCGPMLLATDEEGILCALDWDNDDERMRRLLGQYYRENNIRLAVSRSESTGRRALEAYVAGDLHAIDALPVRMRGTPFQREVWEALRRIPAATTISYGALAAQLNRPSGMRAVGLANGSNPIAVVVPCHRVIGADGSLTGYGGGLERKRWLLEHEGVDLSGLKHAPRAKPPGNQFRLGFAPAAE